MTHYIPKSFLVIFTIAFFVLYPPLYTYLAADIQGIFNYLTGDSFLYLAIARNYHIYGFFTLDGSTPTNGFHPLWQYYLTCLASLGSFTTSSSLLTAAFLSSVSAVTLGACFAGLAIFRITRSYITSLLIIPGTYFMMIGMLVNSQAIWDNIDGMECCFSFLFGGIFLYLFAALYTVEYQIAPKKWFKTLTIIGLCCPFIVLTRLDDVFLLPALVYAIIYLHWDKKSTFYAIILVTIPSIAALTMYLLYNSHYMGVYLPISGAEKYHVSSTLNNLYVTVASLFPPLISLKNSIMNKQSNGLEIYLNTFRFMEVIIPLFFALCYAFFVRTKRTNSWYCLSFFVVIYIFIKCLYNILFVNFWDQGPWYYALIMLFTSFFTAIMIKDVYEKIGSTRLKRMVFLFLIGVIFWSSGRFAFRAFQPETKAYQFWKNREHILTQLTTANQGTPKLIVFDDGIVSFSLSTPTIHGFQFAGDLKSYQEKSKGNLLQHAYERGFDIITSLDYLPMDDKITLSADIQTFLESSFLEKGIKQELKHFNYTLLYIDELTHTPFIKFAPNAIRTYNFQTLKIRENQTSEPFMQKKISF